MSSYYETLDTRGK